MRGNEAARKRCILAGCWSELARRSAAGLRGRYFDEEEEEIGRGVEKRADDAEEEVQQTDGNSKQGQDQGLRHQ